MKTIFHTLLVLGLCAWHSAGSAAPGSEASSASPVAADAKAIRLVVRGDDMGFCHAANMAFKRILEEGTITAISVMVTTPWLDEAVEILKDHPEVSVGLHTCLNSEWKEFRWGPVAGAHRVPSLVDEWGKFFGSRRAMMLNKPKVEEVAAELRAQFELARRKGLKLDYCDHHMGAAVNTREFQREFEAIAREYGVGVSRYFGETVLAGIYSTPPEDKLDKICRELDGLTTPGLYLLVTHPGTDTPELAALTDLNVGGLPNMARHRQAETNMLCHPRFRETLQRNSIQRIGYRQLYRETGWDAMRRPFEAPLYEDVMKELSEKSPY